MLLQPSTPTINDLISSKGKGKHTAGTQDGDRWLLNGQTRYEKAVQIELLSQTSQEYLHVSDQPDTTRRVAVW